MRAITRIIIKRFYAVFFAIYVCFFGESFAQTPITINYNNVAGTSTINSYCYIQSLTAELWGGGGGGGGAYANGTSRRAGAGGGGSGAYAFVSFFIPNSQITVTVGYAGNYGSGNQGGSSGGNSKIEYATNYVQANGGGGGYSANGNVQTAGGSKGTHSGNISYSGTDGNAGSSGYLMAVPFETHGGNGASNNSGSGGTGGKTGTGRGKSDGSNGTIYGGGGGGAAAYTLVAGQIESGNGGTGGAGNVKISFNFAIPDVTINKPMSIFCAGNNDVISVNSSVCSGSTYQWYKDGMPIQNATSSSLTVTESGSYYVVVTLAISDLKTSLGVPATATVSPNNATATKQSGNCVVTVKQATSSTINADICDGDILHLNGTDYSSTGSDIQHTTNSEGCDSAIYVNVIVYPAPEVEVLTTETCTDGLIELSFTGQPPFTVDYTVNIDCIGTNLDPTSYGLPIVFEYDNPNISSWINNGTHYLAGIQPHFAGKITFHLLKIKDGIGCKSVRP